MILPAGAYPDTKRRLRLAIHNDKRSALLYSVSDIEVLNDGQPAAHPYLSRLGPDLLDESVTVEQVAARLAEQRHAGRCLMALLQDQRVLAGMGNYLCCEVLFVAGLHPITRPRDCPPGTIRHLADACLTLTRRSYRTGGVTNDPARAERLRSRGAPFEQYRFHVFRRAGLPCYACGETIVKARFSGKVGYVRPHCQPRP